MPREGTKTHFNKSIKNINLIEIRYAPGGDENFSADNTIDKIITPLRLDKPREGTKTGRQVNISASLVTEIRYAPGGDENTLSRNIHTVHI